MEADTLIEPQDLELIDATLYEPKLEELVARTIFSLKTNDPPWAESVGWQMLSRAGSAKVMHPQATDVPFVDVDFEFKLRRAFIIRSGFQIREDELEAAKATGKPLDATLAAQCRRYINEEENAIVFNGDTKLNIEGIFTVAGKQTQPVPNGTWSGIAFTDGYKIVEDIKAVKAKLTTLRTYKPQVLLLHPDLYEHLEKFVSTTRDTTVLEHINKLGWFPGGIIQSTTLPTDKIAVIDTAPENCQLSILKDLFRRPPWNQTPFATAIIVEEKLAGLLPRYPLSIVIGTGV